MTANAPSAAPDPASAPDAPIGTALAAAVTTGAAPQPLSIERLEADALECVRDLIRIETVNTGDPATIGDGELTAARYVARKLAEVGIPSDIVESRPGRASLVARVRGSDPARGALVVHAHLDVVPVEARDWTHPPFGAEIHDGVLYGRGAVDMKNFAGTALAVAREFARTGTVPRRDLILAFFADEESGGKWGARWLVDRRPDLFAGATEAIGEVGGFSVPLPGGRRGYLAAVAEKGASWAELTVRGRASHGSRPTADNTVVRLARAVAAIGDHRFPLVKTPAVAAFLEAYARETGVEFDDERLEEQLEELGFLGGIVGASLRTTAVPTVLEAGGKVNVIPAEAKARLDVRVLPGDEGRVEQELRDAVGDGVSVRWVRGSEPSHSPVHAELVAEFGRAIAAEDPDGVVLPFLLPASTDAKHLARLGIRGYGFVPLRVEPDEDVYGRFHTADECISVEALAFCARVTARIFRDA